VLHSPAWAALNHGRQPKSICKPRRNIGSELTLLVTTAPPHDASTRVHKRSSNKLSFQSGFLSPTADLCDLGSMALDIPRDWHLGRPQVRCHGELRPETLELSRKTLRLGRVVRILVQTSASRLGGSRIPWCLPTRNHPTGAWRHTRKQSLSVLSVPACTLRISCNRYIPLQVGWKLNPKGCSHKASVAILG
jgi:hypothetical protein